MDKYEAAAEVFEKYDYNIDDVAKLLCRLVRRNANAVGVEKTYFRQVIYGEGSKFILRVNMVAKDGCENKEENEAEYVSEP